MEPTPSKPEVPSSSTGTQKAILIPDGNKRFHNEQINAGKVGMFFGAWWVSGYGNR